MVPVRKRIPILFVVHSLGHGGMERQLACLAAGIDRARFAPYVASVVEGFRADELRKLGIPILPIPVRTFWDPGPLAISDVLSGYIRQHGIRIVHLFSTGLAMVTALAVKKNPGVRFVTSQRFFMGHVPRKYRYMLLPAHWMADLVVTNCAATRQHLHRDYFYPLGRIAVCYNGIDAAAFAGPRERCKELKDASLVIGCVCVLRPEKDLPLLIRAFARVRGLLPGMKLLMMGSGPEESRLHALARELELGDSCRFVPSAADVAPAMRSIDIFVHPSLTESLPNAVMEAMAAGCCVIATRVGGCPELIEHGVHGLLSNPGDLEDLVAKLRDTVLQTQERTRMGAAALRRISEEFSVERSVTRMTGIYEQVLGSR
jgi:glycosyltransferase involved in cell wall biosynthesis